jgi:hypothetical protein
MTAREINSSVRPETISGQETAPTPHTLFRWTAVFSVLASFGLGDVSVIAWSAKFVSAGELAAAWVSFAMITFGVLVTAFLAPAMKPSGQRRHAPAYAMNYQHAADSTSSDLAALARAIEPVVDYIEESEAAPVDRGNSGFLTLQRR